MFDTPVARPFKINASDVAVVLTSKPQGKVVFPFFHECLFNWPHNSISAT